MMRGKWWWCREAVLLGPHFEPNPVFEMTGWCPWSTLLFFQFSPIGSATQTDLTSAHMKPSIAHHSWASLKYKLISDKHRLADTQNPAGQEKKVWSRMDGWKRKLKARCDEWCDHWKSSHINTIIHQFHFPGSLDTTGHNWGLVWCNWWFSGWILVTETPDHCGVQIWENALCAFHVTDADYASCACNVSMDSEEKLVSAEFQVAAVEGWMIWWRIQPSLLQLRSTRLWIHVYWHPNKTRQSDGSMNHQVIFVEYPQAMKTDVSQHKKSKGITRPTQKNNDRYQQLTPEQIPLLPAEQRVLSKSHEVNLTAASWLHRGKEDLVIPFTQELEFLGLFVHENSFKVPCVGWPQLNGLFSPTHHLVRLKVGDWCRHLSPLQHRILGDSAVGVDVDALVFVANQNLCSSTVW